MFYKQPSENRFYRHETPSAHFTFTALLEKGALVNKIPQAVVVKRFTNLKQHPLLLGTNAAKDLGSSKDSLNNQTVE
jgi:hypothetical protein